MSFIIKIREVGIAEYMKIITSNVDYHLRQKGFDMFKDKVLLITGGTGSFGNAVLERFLGEFY